MTPGWLRRLSGRLKDVRVPSCQRCWGGEHGTTIGTGECTCVGRCGSWWCQRTDVGLADFGRAGRVRYPDDQLRDETKGLRHRDKRH